MTFTDGRSGWPRSYPVSITQILTCFLGGMSHSAVTFLFCGAGGRSETDGPEESHVIE